MDLDGFDAALRLSAFVPDRDPLVKTLTAKDAVEYIDLQWYAPVVRRGRWMDLIGDYAGSEPFIVDGTYFYWPRSVDLLHDLLSFYSLR